MFIRSQDKKSLINLDNVTQIYINDCNIVSVDFNNDVADEYGGYIDVGEYSTEEKALKVLDMMQQSYLNVVEILDQSIANESYWVNIKNQSNVFQMPSDEYL